MGKGNKTKPEAASVEGFLGRVDDPKRRADAQTLNDLLAEATGAEPVMWGSAIVGFGTHHYVYDSGREGDTPAVGFSPRKAALTIYGIYWYGEHEREVAALGDVETGKGCVYVKDLAAIDQPALAKLARQAFEVRHNAD